MNSSKIYIDGLTIIQPNIIEDERGHFLESFNQKEFNQIFHQINFVQDNESKSYKGVLRGLHFQKPPFSQAKLVRCIEGKVLDVAVDIRKGSPTFGHYHSIILSGTNKKQLYIPRGFAHGYLVLSDFAIFCYKVDNFYSPEHEGGIIWDDKDLNIEWGVEKKDLLVSLKDLKLPSLSKIDTPFTF